MIRFIPASSRWTADYGWLKTAYSFSFSNYYDPARMWFGALRVLNDDIISGGMWFPEHPHENMEIITIVTDGALQHGDDMWSGWVIKAGDVQVMSAWQWVHHSEFNASKVAPAALFQLWIQPHTHAVEPRYDQKTFWWDKKKNEWTMVVSPDGRNQSLMIHQYAYISLWVLDMPIPYLVKALGNGLFIMCIRGSVRIGDYTLGVRDVVEITEMNDITITPWTESQIMVVEVPMRI